MIDNIELEEPDHVWDNHPDRVELFRTRARRQARENRNAVRDLPTPKILFPEQNTITKSKLTKEKQRAVFQDHIGFLKCMTMT